MFLGRFIPRNIFLGMNFKGRFFVFLWTFYDMFYLGSAFELFLGTMKKNLPRNENSKSSLGTLTYSSSQVKSSQVLLVENPQVVFPQVVFPQVVFPRWHSLGSIPQVVFPRQQSLGSIPQVIFPRQYSLGSFPQVVFVVFLSMNDTLKLIS